MNENATDDDMNPDVFLFCVCDRVDADRANPMRINIKGVFRNIRSTADPAFPCWCGRLTAFALLNFNGEADVGWRIVEVHGSRAFFQSRSVRMRFVAAPTHAIPWAASLRFARFHRPGEYRTELIFDGNAVADWTFFVTARTP